ncbi:MAG: 2-polyprenyl-6-methoxyphenol 4-hydroxylase [Gammaproteobacteria bacterium]|jgi:2-octaprenyl-6-methoxyphenol hydroxylase|nr:2-polyprenyl-6-methoxyphenol 4-hydroxylase [Gammaproteobacteria bacterium]
MSTFVNYHHIIIGSGLIGTIAAIALAQKSYHPIAIIDAKSLEYLDEQASPLDTRTLALNASSIAYLKQLDLWRELAWQTCPIKQVHISEKGAFGGCLFDCEDVHETALGYVIEIKNLQKVLLQALKQYPNITVFNHTSVKDLKYANKFWAITTQTQTLQAANIVLADGTQSQLRDKLGIECDIFDYQQTAIVAVAHCAAAHRNIAYERFAGDDILAVLPLTEDRIGTVLVTSHENAKEYLKLNDADYLSHLQKLIGYRLGRLTKIGKKQSYPLKQVIAKQFSLNHLVLLGNTAHTINPIGAQGLNLGLAGVKNYVESREEFEMQQRTHCERLIKFTRQTDRIFRSEDYFTQLGRRFALFALEHSHNLKRRFMRQMMGL